MGRVMGMIATVARSLVRCISSGTPRARVGSFHPRTRGCNRAAQLSLPLLALCLAPACQSITNAVSEFNVFSLEQDRQMGAQGYEEIMADAKVITSGPKYRMVQRITNNLREAALVESPEIAASFDWEVRLVDAPETVNAFCFPGGKMGVYSGIIAVAQSEAGLAVVMGHELAHALHRHGTEALTRSAGVDLILSALGGQDELTLQGLGLGTRFIQLGFGRRAELQSDDLGLTLMARAGYDPREAIGFWRRMQAQGGDAPPEWLSTHPSHETRIEEIEALMPKALEIYRGGGKKAAAATIESNRRK